MRAEDYDDFDEAQAEYVRANAATRSERNSDTLADIIGSVQGGGEVRARDAGDAFGDMLVERRNKP